MTGRTLTPAERLRYQRALEREDLARSAMLVLEDAHARASREVLDSPDGDWSQVYYRAARADFLRRLHAAREDLRHAEEHTTQVLGEIRGVLTSEAGPDLRLEGGRPSPHPTGRPGGGE